MSTATRALRREWRNKNSGWTRRIKWYDNGSLSFRLQMQDEHCQIDLFLHDRAATRQAWDEFKSLADSRPPLDPADKSIVREIYARFRG